MGAVVPMNRKPIVVVDLQEETVTTQALEHLANAERGVYVRGGKLVHIVEDFEAPRGMTRGERAPRITELHKARMRELLAESVEWVKYDGRKQSNRPCRVPDWAVAGAMHRGTWPQLPPLAGLVECPVMRPDGSIVEAPGYDEATALVYQPNQTFPRVPGSPTRDDAIAALKVLEDPFQDFPFVGKPHLYAIIAAVLTLLGRYAFRGPTPLVAINKNVRGAGGSKLAECVGLITRGREPARSTHVADEQEARKRVMSIALAGEPLVLLDNVTDTLGGNSLESALTLTKWSDRLLGGNEQISVALDALWMANGNGLTFTGDCLRRALLVELASDEERPENRTGFAYPDLAAHIRSARPSLVVAGLTLMRAWVLAGRPQQGLRPWGSYEGWTWIRDAIVWAGGVDPLDGKVDFEATADTEAASLTLLLERWREVVGATGRITASGLLKRLWDEAGQDESYEPVREAVLDLCPTAKGLPSPSRLGKTLTRYKGRVAGRRRLTATRYQGTMTWSVEEV